MATTYTNGVYDNTKQKTVNRSLSLSGSNAEVVLLGKGNVTSLSAFGVLYNDTPPSLSAYGPIATLTLTSPGLNTTITSLLTATGTEFAVVDTNGMTVVYTLTAGTTTLFADLTAKGAGVGPEKRRKRNLGY